MMLQHESSKAKFKYPVIPVSGLDSWCSRTFPNLCVFHSMKTLLFNMMWQAHIVLQMRSHLFFFFLLLLTCIKAVFLLYPSVFPTFSKNWRVLGLFSTLFHQEPWMKMSSQVTDVRREGLSVCTTVLPWHCFNTSMPHNKQSEKPGVSRWEQFGFLLIVSKT